MKNGYFSFILFFFWWALDKKINLLKEEVPFKIIPFWVFTFPLFSNAFSIAGSKRTDLQAVSGKWPMDVRIDFR